MKLKPFSFIFTFLLMGTKRVCSIPNVPAVAAPSVPTNAINGPNAHHESPPTAYPTQNGIYNNNSNNAIATLISYLYGSLVPALIAQQQQQLQQNNSTVQQPSSYPMQYYQSAYPAAAYQTPATMLQHRPETEGAINERVSRAVPTDNTITEEKNKNIDATLPLNIIAKQKNSIDEERVVESPKSLDVAAKHAKSHHYHHHKKSFIEEKQKIETHPVVKITKNNTKPVMVELPIACPKCGAKMKLIIGLSVPEVQEDTAKSDDFCMCDENKPNYFCECTKFNVPPQVCSVCNKIKRYPYQDESSSAYAWGQQMTPTPIVVLRRTTTTTAPMSYGRSVFSQPTQDSCLWPTQPNGQFADYGTVTSEPSSITKRYAVFPSNESPVYNNFLKTAYDMEHEPTCYCWRCRFFRKYY